MTGISFRQFELFAEKLTNIIELKSQPSYRTSKRQFCRLTIQTLSVT